MITSGRHLIALIFSAVFTAGACNSINGVDAFTFDAEEPSGPCGPDAKLCFGVCVSVFDPSFGCAGGSCLPCPGFDGSIVSCEMGACSVGTGGCGFPYADCDPTIPGCETLVDGSNPMHCGKCFNACPPFAVCCPDGICADVLGDANHCGGCNSACSGPNTWCSNGICDCKLGFGKALNSCVNFQNDPTNCGMAGNMCMDIEVCENGNCKASCSAGMSTCSRSCTNTKSDPANCGMCGISCGGNQICSGGLCADFTLASAFGCDACPCPGCEATGLPTCTYYPGTMMPICLFM